jgi:hypothetical protein
LRYPRSAGIHDEWIGGCSCETPDSLLRRIGAKNTSIYPNTWNIARISSRAFRANDCFNLR